MQRINNKADNDQFDKFIKKEEHYNGKRKREPPRETERRGGEAYIDQDAAAKEVMIIFPVHRGNVSEKRCTDS